MDQAPQASSVPASGSAVGLPVWLALAGAALVVIGSFLPWGTVSALGLSQSVTGTSGGDGWITLIFGLAIGVLGALAFRGRLRSIGVIVLGALTALLGIYEITQLNDLGGFEELGVDVSVGIGIWLVMIGAIAAIVGGVLGRRSS